MEHTFKVSVSHDVETLEIVMPADFETAND
jgi:hypothetical protein